MSHLATQNALLQGSEIRNVECLHQIQTIESSAISVKRILLKILCIQSRKLQVEAQAYAIHRRNIPLFLCVPYPSSTLPLIFPSPVNGRLKKLAFAAAERNGQEAR